jgi:tripartite-type tricarboxylate transporter receptor subunit TctC
LPPADGYTLLVGSSTLWVNAILYPQIPYDPVRDFEPIIIGATSPEVLVVHPSVPAKTVQELVAYSISNTQTILRAARPARALRLSLRGGRSLQQS